jgi:riboflavin synthase
VTAAILTLALVAPGLVACGSETPEQKASDDVELASIARSDVARDIHNLKTAVLNGDQKEACAAAKDGKADAGEMAYHGDTDPAGPEAAGVFKRFVDEHCYE